MSWQTLWIAFVETHDVCATSVVPIRWVGAKMKHALHVHFAFGEVVTAWGAVVKNESRLHFSVAEVILFAFSDFVCDIDSNNVHC